jgi:hypothetical protein
MITTTYTVTCDNNCGDEITSTDGLDELRDLAVMEGWSTNRGTGGGEQWHCETCPAWCYEGCGALAADNEAELCTSCHEANN